jgi:ribosomal protein S18 acetylase RimI-like enzyme
VTTRRPATEADLPAIEALQRSFDEHWFGAAEHDRDEVQEWLDLGEATCLVHDGDRLLGAGVRWRTGSSLLLDPLATPAATAAALVEWLGEVGAPDTEVLDRDEALRAALADAGWSYSYSSFDLQRSLGEGWVPAPAEWPAGYEVTRMAEDEVADVHRLIYDDAGWADVAGHHHRDLAEWRKIFLDGRPAEERPVLARHDGRLVGAVLIRVFSDNMGWIAQLAVARSERGRGVGRRLLLDGFGRLAAMGADKLGLSVIAGNRTALQLYLGVGLVIDREWQTFAPSA